MKLVWYCYRCKKKIEKKPKKIGNTVYIPEVVTHKHRGIEHVLQCMTLDEYIHNPKYKGY